MNLESITNYCLSKKGAIEDFPFDEDTLVFKVAGKIFTLIPLEKIPLQINLKCDPEKAIELRENFEEVQPGWHMSKNHWNTILLDGNIRWGDLKEWIDHSYDEVVKGLKKSEREKLKTQ
ncbi:MAG: MmcQ/YjbR family DNA-binding protein [Ignavibacteriaceae bacterium]|nr:MmcQ/YjbR family DNA-binding protein [Ignavibacterium sp.]MCC6253726.1 MmcQ/YjbR family DNA-binding protein [Ignavibacteriaceae bacterium]HRN26366.1 MmcQ/YjbR family DNA-binding protein [Ignavibacteriaceae bacterium]HRP91501.1 MmcQ/YjbR family DNA-binding protein [Ignavibacteriaceae bacterium]HRQ54185.1 MmcQ/YjbR family DNA-binding protein [Ignavibacteriaceae bacterium]